MVSRNISKQRTIEVREFSHRETTIYFWKKLRYCHMAMKKGRRCREVDGGPTAERAHSFASFLTSATIFWLLILGQTQIGVAEHDEISDFVIQRRKWMISSWMVNTLKRGSKIRWLNTVASQKLPWLSSCSKDGCVTTGSYCENLLMDH